MIFLEKAFINNSWEKYEEPKRIVDGYLSKLETINDTWSYEISNAISNSNTARGALASSLRPRPRPSKTTTIRPPAQLTNTPVTNVEITASNVLITNSLPE